MKIVCLGWGSLIEDSGKLLIDGEWHNDGPHLPIEFARQSQNGRITLVIHESFSSVPTLWANMTVEEKDGAIESLKTRERTVTKNVHSILSHSEPHNEIERIVLTWIQEKGIDCAIWTGLPPKFNGTSGTIPTLDDLREYIERQYKKDRLKFSEIEKYIRKTPEQVQTVYRGQLEAMIDEIEKQSQS